MAKRKAHRTELPHVGWREWIALPELGISAVKAKVDTGARSSALHAFGVREFSRDGISWVRFKVHPLQRNTKVTVAAEAELLEYRLVRSSTGHLQRRPVICTQMDLHGNSYTIELTLTNRDAMGFRMLIGRQAVRGRFLVDPGHSYKMGRIKKKKKKIKKKA